jgi:hypothetical protein
VDSSLGLFSQDNPLAGEDLQRRIAVYAAAGKKLDLFHPEESAAVIAADIFKGRTI